MSTSNQTKSFVAGRRPWFQALRFAVACAGVGVTGSIVGLVWPSLIRLPSIRLIDGQPCGPRWLVGQTVTLLLVGVDADALSDSSNGAAPPGKANADAVLLARFQNSVLGCFKSPPNWLFSCLVPMGSWRYQGSGRGGIKLLRDAIAEIVGLDDGHPQRFVDVTICPSLCC